MQGADAVAVAGAVWQRASVASGSRQEDRASVRDRFRAGRSAHVDVLDDLTRRLLLLHDQMEQLVCALDIQQLVLVNNRLRWLPAVTENVEMLVEEIRTSEVERLPVARSAAVTMGASPDATLAELADAAGEPYRSSWRRIRLQLLALHQEIDQITATNRDLGRHGAAAAGDVVTTLGVTETPTHYSATGRSEPVTTPTHRFDRTA